MMTVMAERKSPFSLEFFIAEIIIHENLITQYCIMQVVSCCLLERKRAVDQLTNQFKQHPPSPPTVNKTRTGSQHLSQ